MDKYKQFQLISVQENKLGNGQLLEMQEYFAKPKSIYCTFKLHINKRSDLCFPTFNFHIPLCVNYIFFLLILPSDKQGYTYTLIE